MTRTILVTGVSSGIGLTTAHKLLDAGHNVIGVSRRAVSINHSQFEHEKIDLSQLETLPDTLKNLSKKHPHIHSLVLAAGQGLFGSLEEFSFAQIQAHLNINFTSNALIARHFIPLFKQRKQGDMIFIGSEAALQGKRKGSLYCAAKFALRGFTQALRDESARSGIRIMLINPGMTQTPFFDNLNFEPGRDNTQHILPEDIASLIVDMLTTRRGTVVDEINLSPLNHVVIPRKV